MEENQAGARVRDPKVDPRPGDRYRDVEAVLTLLGRGTMPRDARSKFGIRGGSEFVTYTVSYHPALTCYHSLTGFKKRVKNLEVLHVAD